MFSVRPCLSPATMRNREPPHCDVPLNVPLWGGCQWILLNVTGSGIWKKLNRDNHLQRSVAVLGTPWKVEVERAKGTAPGHQLVYYEHFFRSRHHGMDSIVDSSLRPGQRRPLRVIQSEPSTSINSQSIGFHSEVYPSTGTSRHRPQWAGELRPQRTGSSSTGLASSFTRARNRFMGSEGSPRRRSR